MSRRAASPHVPFRDLLLLMLQGVVVLVAYMVVAAPTSDKQDLVAQPGTMVVEISWPGENHDDVDLWVQAPGEKPVGYSNHDARCFNLLRDDLGGDGAADRQNREQSVARCLPPGDYTVNVHLFRAYGPVTVHAEIMLKSANAPLVHLPPVDETLRTVDEEITLYRFTIGYDGALVPDSINRVERKIRSLGVAP